MDHFISQILEQHQPSTTPADEQFITNLPYLKVRSKQQETDSKQDTNPNSQAKVQSDQKPSIPLNGTSPTLQQQQDCTNYNNFLKSSSSVQNGNSISKAIEQSMGNSETPQNQKQEFAQGYVGDPCSVCWENFVVDMRVLELPCGHDFHKDCLLPWLEKQNTCPVCRAVLPAKNEIAPNRNNHNNDNGNDDDSNSNSHSNHEDSDNDDYDDDTGEDGYYSEDESYESDSYSTAASSDSSHNNSN